MISCSDQYFSSVLHKGEPLSLLWVTVEANHHGSQGPDGLQALPHSGFQKDGAQLPLSPSLEEALPPGETFPAGCHKVFLENCVGSNKGKGSHSIPPEFLPNLLLSYPHMLGHFLNVIVLNGLRLTKIKLQ